MDIKLDQWASAVPTGFPGAIAPPLGKRQEGFQNGEEPAAAHFNWVFQALSDLQVEIGGIITSRGLTLDAANLTQLSHALDRASDFATTRLVLNQWAQQTGGVGSDVNQIVEDSAGNLLAVGNSGLIRYSTDLGVTWSSVTPAASFGGDFRCCVWDAFNSLWVIAGASGEIQTSPDGTTFTHRAAASSYSGTFFSAAATSGGSAGVVLVGSGGELQSSTNSTSYIRQLTGGSDFVDVSASNSFVAVKATGIYRSATGTSGWSLVDAVRGGNSVCNGFVGATQLWVAAAGSSSLNLSSDDGLTWSTVSASRFSSGFGFGTTTGVIVCDFNTGYWFGISGQDFFMTRDPRLNQWVVIGAVGTRTGQSGTPKICFARVGDGAGKCYLGSHSKDRIFSTTMYLNRT